MGDRLRRLLARVTGRRPAGSPSLVIGGHGVTPRRGIISEFEHERDLLRKAIDGTCMPMAPGGLPFDPDHPDAWRRYAAERAALLERFRTATPGRVIVLPDLDGFRYDIGRAPDDNTL